MLALVFDVLYQPVDFGLHLLLFAQQRCYVAIVVGICAQVKLVGQAELIKLARSYAVADIMSSISRFDIARIFVFKHDVIIRGDHNIS